MANVNRLVNANIYAQDNSLLGCAEEVNVPEVKFKKAAHKSLGMVGEFELFSGFEKMEGSIKWNAPYADVIKLFASTDQIKLQVRGNLETHTSTGLDSESKIVYYLTVQTSNIPGANFKQHDNVELSSMFTCTYVKLEINDEEIYEVDTLANIYVVDGVDKLANYRANLGI